MSRRDVYRAMREPMTPRRMLGREIAEAFRATRLIPLPRTPHDEIEMRYRWELKVEWPRPMFWSALLETL